MKLPESLITKIAKEESVKKSCLKKFIRMGWTVVPCNTNRKLERPCAIGKGLTTKVNANIGLSPDSSSIDNEMKKMDMAVRMGAHTIMDLSIGGNSMNVLRKRILSACPVPVGTVPIYELACMKNKKFTSLKENDFLDVVRRQADEGVDFFTIHSAITLEAIHMMRIKPRIMNIVSRGGALLASWMTANRRENPFFSRFDDIVKIVKEYNITLSLGDSLRPGSILDASDQLQIHELLTMGRQQAQALAKGVQVMIEGPGHMPLDQIEANVRLQKSVCNGAPFYVLGPLVTDAAPGYDHITGAIGGAIAAWHGADFLCYVTPAEHLSLPDIEDVRRGVIASRIAAHAADIVKGIPSAILQDQNISKARAKRDWEKQFKFSLDPEKPARIRKSSHPKLDDICTMCAEYCSIKMTEESLKNKKSGVVANAVNNNRFGCV